MSFKKLLHEVGELDQASLDTLVALISKRQETLDAEVKAVAEQANKPLDEAIEEVLCLCGTEYQNGFLRSEISNWDGARTAVRVACEQYAKTQAGVNEAVNNFVGFLQSNHVGAGTYLTIYPSGAIFLNKSALPEPLPNTGFGQDNLARLVSFHIACEGKDS